MAAISFEIWLFAVKGLAQTYDMAMNIYEQLADNAKKELEEEYRKYCELNK